jgi:hypothetical protein
MLLVITNSEDATADFLCGRFNDSRTPYLRINSDDIAKAAQVEFQDFEPTFILDGNRVRASEISNIWLRRPKPLELSDEHLPAAERLHIQGEWSEALEGFLAHIPVSKWINHPTANVMASHKMEQLSRAKRHGLKAPETLVTQNLALLQEFWAASGGQIIVKPLCSGYIERHAQEADSLIYTNTFPSDLLRSPSIEKVPTLFQRRVDKITDIRVTVIDTHVHAVSLSALDSGVQRLDIRRNNMFDVTYSAAEVPKNIEGSLLKLIRSYGLRFAAVDFVVDRNGDWIFLEINPNGQWAWLDLAGCTDIATSFVRACNHE